MLDQCCNYSKQCRNSDSVMNHCIALKIVVANRLRVTLPLASRTEVRSALSHVTPWEAIRGFSVVYLL